MRCQNADELVLALEVSGSFKEHWEGLTQPIRKLRFYVKLRLPTPLHLRQ